MSNLAEYKKAFIMSLIGIPAALLLAYFSGILKPEKPETLAEFSVQVNPSASPSYSMTLTIDKNSHGYLAREGKKTPVSDLYFQPKSMLRFQAQIGDIVLTFSGPYIPTVPVYRGLIIGEDGSDQGTWSAQKISPDY